jgi:N-hydroxyarylamine O-acetyltransferase
MDRLDLEAYFARIGWEGSRAPNFAVLAGVLAAHTASIPFENFDVLLGRKIRLDLESLQQKLVTARRGGYCFEQASLLAAVLTEMGFSVKRHASRVVVMRPAREVVRGHMFLTVEVEGGRFVVDPGFGGMGAQVPVPLDGTAVPAGKPTHRLAREDDVFVLHVTRQGVEGPGWVSTMEEENPIDFEMANYFTESHEASQFTKIVMASAVTASGRVNVMNRDVTRISADGVVKEVLADRRALRALVAAEFGFDLAALETMRVPAVAEWA